MTLANGAEIATIAQAVLVVVSLAFVVYQLRQNAELARAANAQHLTEQAASFNALLYANADLAELWYSYGAHDADRIKQLRYREMLVQWMIMHENIFHQWKKGLLHSELYTPWQRDLERTVKAHKLELLSKDIRNIFPGQFGQEVWRLQRGFERDPK